LVANGPTPGAIHPDWERAWNTLQVPACSGSNRAAGSFLRCTKLVALSSLFEAYGASWTSAEIYGAWLQAPIVGYKREFRSMRMGNKGKAKGKGKGKDKR